MTNRHLLADTNGGRVAVEIAGKIGERYLENGEPNAVFLPSQRNLAADFKVSNNTIQRALTMLETQGYIRREHGRGCRILQNKVSRPYRVAILQAVNLPYGAMIPQLVSEISTACLRRKWQVLNIDTTSLDPATVVRTIKDAAIHAALIAFDNAAIAQALVDAGITCIDIESKNQGVAADMVSQDSFGAAAQIVQFLVKAGYRRLGWIGQTIETQTAFARFCGARSALLTHGLDFAAADVVPFFNTDDEAEQYLRNPDKPRAVLCMWFGGTQQLIRTANRMGIKAKDLFLAGWGMDRHIKEIAADIASTCINLISVSWSIQEMAEVVVSRLHIHRMEPDLKPLHLAIPARLLNKKQLLALAKKSRLFLQI